MGCQNQGLCQLGFKNGTDINDQSNFFQYCDCPNQFVGKFCEEENTAPTNSPSSLTTTLGPTVTGIIQPDIPSLESPTPSSSNHFLTDTSNMPSPNPSESGSSGNNDNGDNTLCTMNCEHDGVCVLGYRDATDLEFALDHNFDPNLSVENSAQTQYCDCPSTYSGILCEHFNQDITCEKASCENGSTCKAVPYDDPATTSVSLPVCSCEFNGTHHFAGLGCSEPSTSFCTNSPGMNGFQFCTNNGKCRETLKG
jgi:hypothetical protein